MRQSWCTCGKMNLAFILCLPVIISITCFAEANAEANVSSVISRSHIGVWFDYSVRFYDHEADNAYTKQDLNVMVDLVSTRFGKIVLERAPLITSIDAAKNATPHSRTLVPEVAAEHNVKFPERKVEVVVTFDSALEYSSLTHTSSFKIAHTMAEKANEICPGTVKTLMMDQRFSPRLYFGSAGNSDQLSTAKHKINQAKSKYGYKLAVLMDIRDCGHFKGPLGQKAKENLPYADQFVFFIRPNFHHASFDSDVLHKIFVTRLEDCERKLKEEKPDMKVVPAVVVLPGRESTKRSYDEEVMTGWEMMSKWAEKNDREVIMFEAFDTPLGSIVTSQGWWKLKDKSIHEITKDSFVEKIEEVRLNTSRSTWEAISASTIEENSDEEDESLLNLGSRKGRKLKESSTFSSSSTQAIPDAVYIVLILLTVVCTLLVAVIAGLVYGFHVIMLRQKVNFFINRDSEQMSTSTSVAAGTSSGMGMSNGHHKFHREEDGYNDGSLLEISDTSPIVTYKKEHTST